jgi:hypothetical protein
MTSYRIRVGYNSNHDNADVGDEMLGVLDALQCSPSLIVDEVIRLEPSMDRRLLEEYAASYRKPVEDMTVFIEHEADCDNLPVIVQFASGGGEGRPVKEALRRAVCRIVMEHCHRSGMEVNVTVG